MPNYQPNVPTGTIPLSIDYGNLQGNFQTINTYISRDHVPFSNNSSTSGYHRPIHLVDNGGNPSMVSGTGVLFTKTVTDVTSGTDLFYINSPGGFLSRMTMNFQPISLANGCTFLPGNDTNGVMFQWGSISPPGGNGMITYPIAFPNAVFSIQLTPRNDGSHTAFTYYVDGAPGLTTFNYRGSTTGSNTLFWIAIGN